MSGRFLGKLIDRWSREDEVLPPGAFLGVALHVAGEALSPSLHFDHSLDENKLPDLQSAPENPFGAVRSTATPLVSSGQAEALPPNLSKQAVESLPTGSESTSSYGKTVMGAGGSIRRSSSQDNGMIADGVPLEGKMASLIVHPTPKGPSGTSVKTSLRGKGSSVSVQREAPMTSIDHHENLEASSLAGRTTETKPVTSVTAALKSVREPRGSVTAISKRGRSRLSTDRRPPSASVRQYSESTLPPPAAAGESSSRTKTLVRHSVIGRSPPESVMARSPPLTKARSLESISSNRGDTIFHVIETDPPIPRRRSYASVVRGQLSNVQTQAISFHPRISFGVPAMQFRSSRDRLDAPYALMVSGLRPPTLTIRTPIGINTMSSQGFASALPAETVLPDNESIATGLVMRNGHQYRFVVRKHGNRTETILKPAKT